MKHKSSIFGKSYLVKLLGVEKQVWVHPKDLSESVVANYESHSPLPKTAQARVDRGYVTRQRLFFKAAENDRECTPSKTSPVSLIKKTERWAVTVKSYVTETNKVLDAPVKERAKALGDMVARMQPCKKLMPLLKTSRFTDGTLVHCKVVKPLTSTESKPGYMTCSFCEQSYRFDKVNDVIRHVLFVTRSYTHEYAHMALMCACSRWVCSSMGRVICVHVRGGHIA